VIPRSKTARCLTVAGAGAVALLAALCFTGFFGPAEYGTDERTIRVEPGEEFTLTVPARPWMGEHWYLAGTPDEAVLDYRGTREEIEGTDDDIAGGGDGTAYFDFTARAQGTTTVTLLHCPFARCAGVAQAEATTPPVPTAAATAEPEDEPAYFRYEIRVG
jgi:predicted secreted protein